MSSLTHCWDRLWINAQLATMQGPDLGHIAAGAIAVRGAEIAWVGSSGTLHGLQWSATEVIDANGAWITPGFIDCHTHLVYAGDRSGDFAARLTGASYEEIARAGGGILSTVRATRAANPDTLFALSAARARALLREGVTTLEIKSGYGLETQQELKILQVARNIAEQLGITVHKTFLGAHALPAEYAGRQGDYVHHVCAEMLPAVARAEAADAVDVFCERIAFTPDQTRAIFAAAQALGLPLHIHADQLSDSRGAALAAEFGALSADHLEHASYEGLRRMKAAGVTAVLLPAAYYYLREQRPPPIDVLRTLEVPIAIGTDCNPGTAPIASLLLTMNLACVMWRLTATEVLRAVTVNAARALGLSDRGVLQVGKRADLLMWNLRHPEQLCAEIAMHTPAQIVIGGRMMHVEGS